MFKNIRYHIEALQTVLAGVSGYLFWCIFMISLLSLITPPGFIIGVLSSSIAIPFLHDPNIYMLFYGCIVAPLWEESIFRYAPFEIVRLTKVPAFNIPVLILTSVIFGYLHNGVTSILFQGVGGLIMGLTYLKLRSYGWNVVLHSLTNFMLMFGIKILSQ